MLIINNKYRIPSCWEELTPDQYTAVITAMDRFEEGKTDFNGFKIELVFACIGNIKADPGNEILCENIYRLSEQITFPYLYKYSDPRFENFSESNIKYLKRHLPEDSSEDPEQRLAADFSCNIEFDVCWAKQLLPYVGGLKGYQFDYRNGLVNTNLTAGQYIDANTVLDLYFKNKSEDLLDMLCSILYCIPYESDKVDKSVFKEVNNIIKIAILYNYTAILNWINGLEKYSLIFTHASGKTNKNFIGASNMIYSLAKSGYGTLKEVSDLPLFAFLNLLLKETVDGVKHLASLELKPPEIADKMNMSIEQIQSIL